MATCPIGQQSITWSPQIDISGQPIIDIRFPKATCKACRVRRRCTRSKIYPRGLTIRTQAFHTALQTRRQSQETPEFLKIYHQRALRGSDFVPRNETYMESGGLVTLDWLKLIFSIF